jgi:A/G-specific adenine glycosylase
MPGNHNEIEGPLLSSHNWRRLRAWYRAHGRRLPWRHKVHPWRILLAETLLHRTGAKVVEVLYPVALKEYPSPKAIVTKKNRWMKMAHSAGLFWRARTFVSTCEILVNEYGGRVPSDRRKLESLPGVGHYIASAVRCFGFGIAEFVTDTNTLRLAGRIAGIPVNPAHHRSQTLRKLITRLGANSRPLRPNDNYALLDLAAIVCRPTKPRCEECPLRICCCTGRAHKVIRF